MAEISTKGIGKVIFSSSLGTLIEWYDFYIFGMLAKTISAQFFPEGNDTAALLSTLAIFAAGFLVRPFGALFFGRLGDMIGRKYTFLLTLVLMGGSTFLIGLVPGYKSIGIAAPLLVLLLRLIQGLALGGEYGGAATYVAEHAPAHRRGYFTAWIQTTATLGLFVALGVIMMVKNNMTDASFNAEWGGWRYPFWLSILLVGVSIYIRLRMNESPVFAKLKAEDKTSSNPLNCNSMSRGARKRGSRRARPPCCTPATAWPGRWGDPAMCCAVASSAPHPSMQSAQAQQRIGELRFHPSQCEFERQLDCAAQVAQVACMRKRADVREQQARGRPSK